jgi:hypothetical protein
MLNLLLALDVFALLQSEDLCPQFPAHNSETVRRLMFDIHAAKNAVHWIKGSLTT